MTIVENDEDKLEILTGVQSIGEADFVITTTPSGLYRIEARGPGASPKITEERFTNISLAKRALRKYVNDNAAEMTKKAVIKEGVARRKKLREDDQ